MTLLEKIGIGVGAFYALVVVLAGYKYKFAPSHTDDSYYNYLEGITK